MSLALVTNGLLSRATAERVVWSGRIEHVEVEVEGAVVAAEVVVVTGPDLEMTLSAPPVLTAELEPTGPTAEVTVSSSTGLTAEETCR